VSAARRPQLNPHSRRRQLAFALLLTQLGASLLLLSSVAGVLVLVLPRTVARMVGRSAVSFIYRCCWASAQGLGLMRIDADALDALRDQQGGLILAANHPTMLDAMLVVARLPRSVCVMRADLMRNVFLGPGARLASYIGNDNARSVVRASVAALREGQMLVLFPEGTRTSKPPVDTFKPGITLIAKLADVPIQTVLIRCESPYLRKGWPLLRTPPRMVVIRVTLGERFAASDDCRAALRRIEGYFARELAPPASAREAPASLLT
jgi:1-acyl-sn-glycerol-3-phosphate acyltransferase